MCSGPLFLEIRGGGGGGGVVEKLNVTLRFQFPDGSVGGDPWDPSLGPLVCVMDVTIRFCLSF